MAQSIMQNDQISTAFRETDAADLSVSHNRLLSVHASSISAPQRMRTTRGPMGMPCDGPKRSFRDQSLTAVKQGEKECTFHG